MYVSDVIELFCWRTPDDIIYVPTMSVKCLVEYANSITLTIWDQSYIKNPVIVNHVIKRFKSTHQCPKYLYTYVNIHVSPVLPFRSRVKWVTNCMCV